MAARGRRPRGHGRAWWPAAGLTGARAPATSASWRHAAPRYRRSAAEEHGARAVAHHVLGRTPEHHLDDAGVAVGADEQDVEPLFLDEVDDPFGRVAGLLQLERCSHRVGAQVALGLVEDTAAGA